MIRFTWYELLWLFFIYSFLGWVLETAAATVKQKKFANRGLVNGPFCVIYGIAALFMTFGLQELRGVWLFLFAAIYATVIEWVAGHLIEKAFKARGATRMYYPFVLAFCVCRITRCALQT